MQAVLSFSAPAFTPGLHRRSTPSLPSLKSEQPPTAHPTAADQAPSHRRGLETKQSSLALEGVPHAGVETTASDAARLQSVSHTDLLKKHALFACNAHFQIADERVRLYNNRVIGVSVHLCQELTFKHCLQQVEREHATLSSQTPSPRSSGASSLLNQTERVQQQGGGDNPPEEDSTTQVGQEPFLTFINHEQRVPWPKRATA